jgi:uncharacterized protein
MHSYLAAAKAPVRILIFVVILLGLWLPIAIPVYKFVPNPNWVSIITMLILYSEFIGLTLLWGRWVDQHPNQLSHYGLQWTAKNGQELLCGTGLALGWLGGLFGLEGWLGWLSWQSLTPSLLQVSLEGAVIGLGIGFAEELFFRGWLLDELQRSYRLRNSLLFSSFIYAGLHFLKPIDEIARSWPEFPGLLMLGFLMVWAKRATQQRLGLPIGLHTGLVWGYYLINVGQLVRYQATIPDWVVGIDHNPLAGLAGLIALIGLAIVIQLKRSSL